MIFKSVPLTKEDLSGIDNIIFDFGGVLFDIDYDAPVRAFSALGGKGFEAIYAQSGQTQLFDKLETGNISREAFYDEVRAALGVYHSNELLEEAWHTILLDIPKERIDMIYKLKNQFKTYVFSNTNAIHVEEFEKIVDQAMGIEYFKAAFEKVHYSNVLGFKKPYPESFTKYCELEGLEPAKTMFIDDSLQHVEGAEKAGLLAYHIDVTKMDVREVFKALLD
ncbi:MAG: HAD family phosphatase [Flavobacteriales bacterium]|jgi:FMN phosphatase YigB (HAD superfamily)